MQCEYCGKGITGHKRRYCDSQCGYAKRRTDKGFKVGVRGTNAEFNLTCQWCDNEFTSGHSDSKYCSKGCAGKYSYWNRTSPQEYRCSNIRCQKTFTPRHTSRTTYCSRECWYDFVDAITVERDALRRIADAWRIPVVHVLKCAECGENFESDRRGRIYCSDECVYERNKRAIRDKRRGERTLGTRICQECGSEFAQNTLGQIKFCSEPCSTRNSARAAKHRRRARIKGIGYEPVNPIKIFKRDGWRCYLCKRKVVRGKDYLRPDYPTIDHVIPVALGGSHSYQNIRCACRECNVSKGVGVMDEQMLLV